MSSPESRTLRLTWPHCCPGCWPFVGGILGALCRPYVSKHLVTRPKRVAPSVSGEDLTFRRGGREVVDYVSSDTVCAAHFRPIHEAPRGEVGLRACLQLNPD